MRLLEPLNGVKMAQGHYLGHLVLFLGMLTVNVDPHIELIETLKQQEIEAAKPKPFDHNDVINTNSLIQRLAQSE